MSATSRCVVPWRISSITRASSISRPKSVSGGTGSAVRWATDQTKRFGEQGDHLWSRQRPSPRSRRRWRRRADEQVPRAVPATDRRSSGPTQFGTNRTRRNPWHERYSITVAIFRHTGEPVETTSPVSASLPVDWSTRNVTIVSVSWFATRMKRAPADRWQSCAVSFPALACFRDTSIFRSSRPRRR